MSGRFFAFGCSYTRYSYATWADYVGVNFDEYYNYGRGGASNTYIMNKFVEANDKFNFTSDDLVMIMVTGFGRFSYAPKNQEQKFQWKTQGDLYENYEFAKDPVIKSFVDSMYCDDWAVYSSWIALKSMQAILKAKNVPHKFLMSMDNSNYLTEDGSKWGRKDKITLAHLSSEIYNSLDVEEPLDNWISRQQFSDNEFTIWENEGRRLDKHPTQKMHFDFVSEKLSEFITPTTIEFYENANKLFKPTTQHEQGARFINELQFKYDGSLQHGLL